MNGNLNLVEILKDCPRGTRFYSTIYGYVTFICINESSASYPVQFSCGSVTAKGHHCDKIEGAECTFFPSKEQRDWSKWKCPKPDLPIDTPVMVCDDMTNWVLRYYAGKQTCCEGGKKSADSKISTPWKYIVPFDKFNPNNIEGSLKHNIVE